ncbi:MAG: protein phosphatase 2C domain-containing protein [Polyangia bacterium]
MATVSGPRPQRPKPLDPLRELPSASMALPPPAAPKANNTEALLSDVKLPFKLRPVERCLLSPPGAPFLRYGCFSHRGPMKIWPDKENEDFAFAVECTDRTSAPWTLIGVADGVSGSTWGERGAEQACASFISILCKMLDAYGDLEQQMLDPGFREQLFAAALHADLQKRLFIDEREIVQNEIVHPTWGEAGYRETFFTGPNAAVERRSWFQTTLLAAALGPRGGFAFLLGDGFAQVTRRYADGSVQRRPLETQQQTELGGPSLLISRWIQPFEIADSMTWLPMQEAVEIELLLATDGVKNTPDSGVENVELRNAEECRAFLNSLASRPEGQVDEDNLSIAVGAVVLHASNPPQMSSVSAGAKAEEHEP